MKNVSLIVIALLGLSLSTYAQDGTKQENPNKVVAKKPVKKVRPAVGKKKDVPVEKAK
ncbi:hypothetical protein [Fluviicola sp.]|uniref:hypothetical protein n=1 Tax=Fluviicola sp. TaxID=1917219 RepID=UPI0031D81DE5